MMKYLELCICIILKSCLITFRVIYDNTRKRASFLAVFWTADAFDGTRSSLCSARFRKHDEGDTVLLALSGASKLVHNDSWPVCHKKRSSRRSPDKSHAQWQSCGGWARDWYWQHYVWLKKWVSFYIASVQQLYCYFTRYSAYWRHCFAMVAIIFTRISFTHVVWMADKIRSPINRIDVHSYLA